MRTLLMALAVIAGFSNLARADEQTTQHNGFRYRVDVSCEFANGDSCLGLASIFSNSLPFPVSSERGSGSGGGTVIVNPNKMAISCEDHGLVYAGRATWRSGDHHLVISAADGGRPRIIIDTNSRSTNATLVRANGKEMEGHCNLSIHD